MNRQVSGSFIPSVHAGYFSFDLNADAEPLERVFIRTLNETRFGKDGIETIDIVEEDLRAATELLQRQCVSGGDTPFEIRLRYRLPGNKLVYVLCKAAITGRDADGNAVRLNGCAMDITRLIERKIEIHHQNEQYDLLMEGANAGIWDWDIVKGETWWSPKYYALLGYETGEITPSYNTFFHHLLHPDDRQKIVDTSAAANLIKESFILDIRLKTKDGGYRWFESTGKAKLDDNGNPVRMVGTIVDKHEKQLLHMQLEKNEFLLNETNSMAKVGGWEFDFKNDTVTWTKEVFKIHNIPEDTELSYAFVQSLYAEESRSLMTAAADECRYHKKPYDLELLGVNPSGKRKWLHAIGKPILDKEGNVIKIMGAIQDIDEKKRKELELEQSMHIINSQNQRLNNYAHIVSHNLRTHAGNIESILGMIDESEDPDEKATLMEHLHKISAGLNETIEHLNTVAKIQTDIQTVRVNMRFEEVFDKTLSVLMRSIHETGATVEADFSQLKDVEYVPAYLESVMLNLLSNPMKYKHPDRKPHITIKTFVKDNKKFLQVSDNGLGIDLGKYRQKLFGMYKTFHKHPDAKGIGLFITKNQVEALGGHIDVSSEPGIGSTFTVQL